MISPPLPKEINLGTLAARAYPMVALALTAPGKSAAVRRQPNPPVSMPKVLTLVRRVIRLESVLTFPVLVQSPSTRFLAKVRLKTWKPLKKVLYNKVLEVKGEWLTQVLATIFVTLVGSTLNALLLIPQLLINYCVAAFLRMKARPRYRPHVKVLPERVPKAALPPIAQH